tara:strand:+ start:682 stop:1986 length:1305 start_codon:yes stop_codon:yes gene_type:complete
MTSNYRVDHVITDDTGGSIGRADKETRKQIKQQTEYAKEAEKQRKVSLAKTLGVTISLSAILKQSQVFTSTIGSIFQLMGALVDVILAPFIEPIIVPALQLMAKMIPKVAAWAQKIADESIPKIKEYFAPAVDALNKIFNGDETGWADLWNWLGKSAQDFFNHAIPAIEEAMTPVVEWLWEQFEAAYLYLEDKFPILKTIRECVTQVVDKLLALPQDIEDMWLYYAYGPLKIMGENLSHIWGEISEKFPLLIELVGQLVSVFSEDIGKNLNYLPEAIETAIDNGMRLFWSKLLGLKPKLKDINFPGFGGTKDFLFGKPGDLGLGVSPQTGFFDQVRGLFSDTMSGLTPLNANQGHPMLHAPSITMNFNTNNTSSARVTPTVQQAHASNQQLNYNYQIRDGSTEMLGADVFGEDSPYGFLGQGSSGHNPFLSPYR